MRALPLLVVIAGAALAAQDATTARVSPTVATHFFYWYRWPDQHFDEPGAPGPEGHCRHLPHSERVSYESVDWFADEFRAMAGAGIDAALPVYWGAPGAYERANLAFSRRGIAPMVQAVERLRAAGVAAPAIGLFYDTSTLANDVRGAEPAGGLADLTTAAGRDLFCGTILGWFEAIPPALWARHRGGALVVLYVSGFAQRWDRDLGKDLRARFAARFPGETVCLVADTSWGDIGQDLTTAWGAALWGPKLFPGVAQIGPGYDDRAVPGRRTPIREREDGAFYGWSWQQALAHRPELVLLETWNEMHEGTELCATKELGTRYLELTAQWLRRLRAGGPAGAAIGLRWPEPRPQPDLGWGESAKDATTLRLDFAGTARNGLREVVCADGPCAVVDGALRPGLVPSGLGNYLYFQVSDHFAFDADADFELEIVRSAATVATLEYDSGDRAATLAGAYTPRRADRSRRDGERVVETYELRRARFANRQNGGADFRLVLPERAAAIFAIELRRR